VKNKNVWINISNL